MIKTICLILLLSNLHLTIQAENAIPSSSWELIKELNVGWNLGNSLENQSLDYGFIPSGGLGGVGFSILEEKLSNPVTTKAMIDAVADAGFKSIRIPLSFYNHLKESEPRDSSGVKPGSKIDENWLIRIKEIVDWALEAGLYVVINNHHDTSMWMNLSWIYADEETYELQVSRFTNIWEQCASYFKDYDHRLIFQSTGELVNPEREFSASFYRDFQIAHDLNQAFIETVRNTGGNNKDRFLILETYAANSGNLFVDQNFYIPYEDSAKDKLIFGVHNYASDKEILEFTFKELYKRAVKYNMPFIIDECGTKATMDSSKRKEIAQTLSSQAKKYGMAIMVWDDNVSEFGLLDRALCEEKKQVVYRTTYKDGATTYQLNSKEIVESMIKANQDTRELSDSEKQAILNEKVIITDFDGLNINNKQSLAPGQFSETHPLAFNPVTEYINSPTHFAALTPLYYAEGAHFVAKAPQNITSIVIKEMNQDGYYLRSRYTSNGGLYIPSEDACFISIYFRSNNENLLIKDYLNYVDNNQLSLDYGQFDYSEYQTNVVSAIKDDNNQSTTIQWDLLEIADGYRVYRKDKDGIWKAISDILPKDATSFVDTMIGDDDTRYTVRAFVEKQLDTKKVKLWTGYNRQGIPATLNTSNPYRLTSYDFFKWLSTQTSLTDKQRESAEIASRILDDTLTEDDKQIVLNDGSISSAFSTKHYDAIIGYTDIGSEGDNNIYSDATCWDNFKYALELAELGNSYRTNQIENLQALKISSVMMAIAEVNANYQKSMSDIEHSSSFMALENLSYNSLGRGTSSNQFISPVFKQVNPYVGWYDNEKKVYDYLIQKGWTINTLSEAQKQEIINATGVKKIQIGHYLTLTDRNGGARSTTTGFGYINKYYQYIESPIRWTSITEKYSQSFGFQNCYQGDGIEYDQYLALVEQFENYVNSQGDSKEILFTTTNHYATNTDGKAIFWLANDGTSTLDIVYDIYNDAEHTILSNADTEVVWSVEMVGGFENYNFDAQMEAFFPSTSRNTTWDAENENNKVSVQSIKSGIYKVSVTIEGNSDYCYVVVPGDVNRDAHIQANDASIVLRYSSNINPPINDGFTKALSDMNNDGYIQANDASMILRK